MTMTKKSIMLVLLLIMAQFGWSRPIDLKKAENIAQSFLNSNTVSLKAKKNIATSLRLAHTGKQTRTGENAICYYVFNYENGFIIISGDDRAKAVLGYSNTGNFDPLHLPENFKSWLEYCQEQLTALQQIPEYGTTDTHEGIDQLSYDKYAPAVAPLLKKINYDQGTPYNNLCPTVPSTGKAAAGCVATAMAQIMRYYQWPAKGIGSHTYQSYDLGISLTANFGNTTYDWANIAENYNDYYTGKQGNAIATLMLHCGISIDMNYNTSSGAQTTNVPKALINYFGYDKSIQIQERDYFTATEWKSLIKEELNAGRPVIYSGYSSTVGHAFNCDGYDSNDLFHINWGWGGMSNGYFELSILSPSEQGLGGGADGYDQGQMILTGIKPAKGVQTESQPLLRMTSGMYYDSQKDSIFFGLRNLGVGNYKGKIAIGVYKQESLQKTFTFTSNANLLTGYGWSKIQFRPSGLTETGLKLTPIHQPEGSTKWEPIPAAIGMTSYLTTMLANGKISYGIATSELPNLTIQSMKTIGKLYQGKTGRFEFTISNSGVEYNDILRLKIQSPNDYNIFQLAGQRGAVIGNNETQTYQFSGELTLAPGIYRAYIQYNNRNGFLQGVNGNYGNGNNYITVQIENAPTGTPQISILGITTTANSNEVYRDDEITVTATIKNEGSYGEFYSLATIYQFDTGYFGTSTNPQMLYLDSGETQKVSYKGKLSTLEPNRYYARIRYYDTWSGNAQWQTLQPTENNFLPFIVVEGSSAVDAVNQLEISIYPNPVTNQINVSCEAEIGCIRILNLAGETIETGFPAANRATLQTGHLPSGMYLLQIKTEQGTSTSKFIKH